MDVPPTTARAEDPVVDRLAAMGRSPALVLAEGALGTVVGVIVLAWPGPTATVLAVLFAVHLLVSGVLQLGAAFSEGARAGRRGFSAVLGTLSVLVGLLCLRDPLQTLVVLGLLIGVAWTVGGVIRVVQGITAERGATRGWRMVSGAVSFLAGAVVLVYPGASIVVLTAVLGVVLIVEGACLLATGFAMRRRGSELPAPEGAPRPAVPPVPRAPVPL
jgi:uncharacterized membrane protein HdeD (DUF308 family)